MNPDIQRNLALILFLPWYLILGALYWIYPRTPRTPQRRAFDATALALSVLASALGMYWSMFNASLQYGHMWQQVLATSVCYGMFLAVMTLAWIARHAWFTGPRARKAHVQ